MGENNLGDGNSGDGNSGHRNSGHWNSGHRNSGHWNSGHRNSGHWNSGDGNSGDGNSGHRNSGHWNSGDGNSGDGNSGDGNSGHRNSGHWNSGDRNSGHWNSGDRNSGDRNSGYGNSCERSSGIFCTKTPQLFCFNKPTDRKWDEIDHPLFNEFSLTRWVPDSEMTDAEKVAEPEFHVRGGYLKTFTWEEAWQNYWRDSDDAEKQRVLNLPNFDAGVFKEITGIDVDAKQSCDKQSCDGKIVEIDGKKYRLSKV